MILSKSTSLIIVLVLLCSCSGKRSDHSHGDLDSTTMEETPKQAPKALAKAIIQSASESTLTGEAIFEEAETGVVMTLTVKGATPGSHAVHLHQKGDCSAPDATSAEGHWNPHETDHGKRGTDTFHSGDIDNLEVMEDGTGTLTVSAKDWSIGGDEHSNVIGRAVIIHASEDDFVSQPSGNAGSRVGCGVIEKSE